jgi:uncharacterized GH25 family protein
MKKYLVTIFSVFIIASLAAHEFWLQPDKFMIQPKQDVNINFLVGENFDGENWYGNKEKINSLILNTQKSTKNIASLFGNTKGDSLKLKITEEGTAMVLFNSNNSFISLDAEKFNAYLKEDGLQEAIDFRNTNGQNDSAGTELYQRSVKTILQAGKKRTENILKQTSLPLDIVPMQNPYAFAGNDSMHVRIFFKQQLLKEHLVKIWHRLNDKTTYTEAITDSNGEVAFENMLMGRWMVSTVKMIHTESEPKADWQSFWASCTWGYY